MAFREVTDIQLDEQPQAVNQPSQPKFREVTDIQLDEQDKSIGQSIKESAEGLARGGLQGLTFNFADELVGSLGAMGARMVRPDLFENESFAETQSRGIEVQRQKEAEAREAAPGSFLTGEIGGALTTGGAGLTTKAGGKVASFVANAPSKTQAFVRGGTAAIPTGAVQSFGAAEGTTVERLPEAVGGAAVSGVTGGALTAGGKALAEKFTPKVKKMIADIPLTLGQSTQDAVLQSFEESALKGGKGELAQQTMEGFAELQENAVKRKLSDIKTLTGGESDLIKSVTDTIKKTRSQMSAQVDAAYNTAKISGQATLDKKLLKNTLGKAIKDVEADFVLADSPNARRLIKEFNNITKTDKKPSLIIGLYKPATPADIVSLEKWRSRVTNAANNTNNRQEAKFLGSIRTQYDNFVDDVLDNALVQGDDETLRLYQNARNLRKDFGKRFESDQIVSKILTDETLTSENVVNMIVGAGSIKGKETTNRVIDSLYRAAGDAKPEVQQQLKSAIMDRMFTRSASPRVTLDGEPILSFAKLNKEIKLLLNKNSTLADNILEPSERKALKETSKTLDLIVSKKPGVVNNSNTYEKLAANLGVFNRIPLLNLITDSFKSARNAKEAARAIGKITPKPKQSQTQAKFILSGSVALPQTELQREE